MIYIFIFLAISFYLYSTEKYICNSFAKQFIVWLPAYIVFVFPLAFQKGVGTDYETYYNYFYNNGHYLYFVKGEYFYYYLMEFVKYTGEPQLQFFIVSILQGFLFFYLLYLFKKIGYKSWLIFSIYFLVTGIYNNQMNQIRQYISIYVFLISAFFIFQKKYIHFFLISGIGIFFHFSILMVSVVLFFISFIRLNNRILIFLVFLFSILIYSLDLKNFMIDFLNFLNINYSAYIDSEYSDGRKDLTLITKFYYFPLILLFWVMFLKDRMYDKNINYFIFIFSCTYFLILQSIDFGLVSRVWQYFNFFIVFPIYYVLIRSKSIVFFALFLFLSFLYFVKVILFPVAEYDYFMYLDWF